MIVSDQDSDALRIDTTGSNAVQIVGSLFPAVFAEGLKIDANAVTVNILTAGTVAGGGYGNEIIGAETAVDSVVTNAGSVTGDYGFIVFADGTGVSNSGTTPGRSTAALR
ncbi:hypothetical protein [Mameliella alba]|uniref:Uncharacterized protein n=1 Tax=Mameliella alba TaxID=561184 RepID=A0A0B3RYD2_9RHOB|nr:hypothetical protein [Mameliella alba]KHQ51753.1 hypothetical protein OA50_03654 [Mameliella alba]